ncbi:MaoC family dehydratase [Actinomycetospora rhizophila]|uniref:MaoC family dehydratase n=1 Tax=Actinomycetospora rhizophila TaxID=1416876 RepID=A0ABV9ZGV3_9PSEU
MIAGDEELLVLEDFAPGRAFDHHWGRTVTESDVVLWATQTHLYQPAYVNAERARHDGHAHRPVPAGLVFAVVLGLTVEDLSESGGSFLGADAVRFPTPVHVGDTLYASSAVVERRTSRSRPGWGVVTWRTVGTNQHAVPVVEYRRTSMVPGRRP